MAKKVKKKATKKQGAKQGRNPNLAPMFVKGQSGNPNGRPKGAVSLLTKLKSAIRREVKDGLTVEDIINAALLKRAAKGDISAIKLVYELTIGPLKQQHEVSHKVSTFTDFVSELPAPKDDDDDGG